MIVNTRFFHNTLKANFNVFNYCGAGSVYSHYDDTSIGNIISYNWDFGDGGTSTDQNPVHFYNYPDPAVFYANVFPITLSVQDESGYTDSITKNSYIYYNTRIDDFNTPVDGTYPYPDGFKLVAESNTAGIWKGAVSLNSLGGTRKMGIVNAEVIDILNPPYMVSSLGELLVDCGSANNTVEKFSVVWDGPIVVNYDYNSDGYPIEDVPGYTIVSSGTTNYQTTASVIQTNGGLASYYNGFDLWGLLGPDSSTSLNNGIRIYIRSCNMEGVTGKLTLYGKEAWETTPSIELIGNFSFPFIFENSYVHLFFWDASFTGGSNSGMDFTKICAMRLDISGPAGFIARLGKNPNLDITDAIIQIRTEGL